MTDITQLIERLRSIAKGNHSCGHGYDSHEHDTFTSSANALEAQEAKIASLRAELAGYHQRKDAARSEVRRLMDQHLKGETA